MIGVRLGSIKRNSKLFPVGVVVLCFLLIVMPGGIKENIAEICIDIFYLPISNIQGKFGDLYGIRERARQLETELVKTKLELSYYEGVIEENKRLRQFLDFGFSQSADLIPAELIRRPDVPNRVTVLINVGHKQGIRSDMAVITPEGLAGCVQRVFDNSSEVQLLIDPASRVSAVDSRSRVYGILKSHPPAGLMLVDVPGHEDIAVGDTLESSGLGGVYPTGIPIGIISEITILPSSFIFADVTVEPFTRFGSIERLFVVRKESK